MESPQYQVVSHKLTDGSKVYAVKGHNDTGSHLIVIDCDCEETATKIADLLEERTFGIMVSDTFTDRCDRLHKETT